MLRLDEDNATNCLRASRRQRVAEHTRVKLWAITTEEEEANVSENGHKGVDYST